MGIKDIKEDIKNKVFKDKKNDYESDSEINRK